MDQNFFAVSVFNMYIFDEFGKLVAGVDTLFKGDLLSNGKIDALDCHYNLDLIRFLNEDKTPVKSDYERFLEFDGDYVSFVKSDQNLHVRVNQNNTAKKCSVVLVGQLMNSNNTIGKRYVYNIPNASIQNYYDLHTSADGVTMMNISIYFSAFNEEGDLFDLMVMDAHRFSGVCSGAKEIRGGYGNHMVGSAATFSV